MEFFFNQSLVASTKAQLLSSGCLHLTISQHFLLPHDAQMEITCPTCEVATTQFVVEEHYPHIIPVHKN